MSWLVGFFLVEWLNGSLSARIRPQCYIQTSRNLLDIFCRVLFSPLKWSDHSSSSDCLLLCFPRAAPNPPPTWYLAETVSIQDGSSQSVEYDCTEADRLWIESINMRKIIIIFSFTCTSETRAASVHHSQLYRCLSSSERTLQMWALLPQESTDLGNI